MTSSWPRIIVDIGIFVLVFIAPWWAAAILALVAAFFFRNYIELIILGLVLDWLYNAPAAWFGGFQYALTVAAIFSFLLISYLKTFIRFR